MQWANRASDAQQRSETHCEGSNGLKGRLVQGDARQAEAAQIFQLSSITQEARERGWPLFTACELQVLQSADSPQHSEAAQQPHCSSINDEPAVQVS